MSDREQRGHGARSAHGRGRWWFRRALRGCVGRGRNRRRSLPVVSEVTTRTPALEECELMPSHRPHVRLELRPEPSSNPHSDYPRLRKVLKALLRSLGFRCVKMEFLDEPRTDLPDPDAEDINRDPRPASGHAPSRNEA